MNFSASELRRAFGKFYRCDRNIKGGAKLSKTLVLEKLVVDVIGAQ
jgi:DNA polymerase III delta subunit